MHRCNATHAVHTVASGPHCIAASTGVLLAMFMVMPAIVCLPEPRSGTLGLLHIHAISCVHGSEPTGMEGSSTDPLGRDSGRRRVNRSRATNDGDSDSPNGENRGLLDEGRHLV